MPSKQRLWQLKQKLNGNCMTCGKKRDGSSVRLCESCLKKDRTRTFSIEEISDLLWKLY